MSLFLLDVYLFHMKSPPKCSNFTPITLEFESPNEEPLTPVAAVVILAWSEAVLPLSIFIFLSSTVKKLLDVLF